MPENRLPPPPHYARPDDFNLVHLVHDPRTRVLSGVLNAIDVLDGTGFIQRDVKGDNILVGRNGEGILADFGLCVRTTEAAAQRELFGAGTPEYSAPEVSGGQSGSSLCTELYSVSVVFVESVLGRHPFCGEVSQQ